MESSRRSVRRACAVSRWRCSRGRPAARLPRPRPRALWRETLGNRRTARVPGGRGLGALDQHARGSAARRAALPGAHRAPGRTTAVLAVDHPSAESRMPCAAAPRRRRGERPRCSAGREHGRRPVRRSAADELATEFGIPVLARIPWTPARDLGGAREQHRGRVVMSTR